MFISVAKTGDRYSFIVGTNQDDDPRSFFDSAYDFDLVDGLDSDYGSYAEAHASGLRLIKAMPSSIMARKAVFEDDPDHASPEERTVRHFSEQVTLMGERLPSIESMPEEDRGDEATAFMSELKAIEDSINGVMGEVESSSSKELLENLLSDLSMMRERISPNAAKNDVSEPTKNTDDLISDESDPSSPVVPSLGMTSSDKANVLLSFGVSAAKSIIANHKTAHVRLVEKDDDTDSYFVHLADEGGDVCSLKFNNDLLLTGMVPSNRVAMVHPYHSIGFLERYWEPMVMAVGHYGMPGKDIAVSHCHEDSSRCRLAGVDTRNGSKHFVSIVRKGNSWWIQDSGSRAIKTASSDPVDMNGMEVRCVRKNLPTYYGRTGAVVRVIPRADRHDLVVDFRRGLGTLVLTNEDIETI
jgi:hypothetical protein